jgi:hypothetical protein
MEVKSALEYLFVRLKDKQAASVEIRGEHYKLDHAGVIVSRIEPVPPRWPEPLACATLCGLIDFAANADRDEKVAFHIERYNSVSLVALQADDYGRRRVYATASHGAETPFEFGVYMPPEKFRVDFLASFLLTEDAMNILRLISTIGTTGETVNVSDDGLSQAVEIRSGAVVRSKVALPTDGIPLIPWRTFRDVPPVTSKFLLRLKSDGGAPKVALHEIDARWKLDTITAINTWLNGQMPGSVIIG